MNDFKILLPQLIAALPMMVVFGIALVMSIAKYQECPQAYLWSAIGMVILLVQRLVQISIYGYFLPQYIGRSGASTTSLSTIYLTVNLILGLIFAAGIICVLVAVFAGRKKISQNGQMI